MLSHPPHTREHRRRSHVGIDKLNVKRSDIPAVTHVDYSARIQTIRRDQNPLDWEIIDAFQKKTECPVIVNTSFNVRVELSYVLRKIVIVLHEDRDRLLVMKTFVLDKKEHRRLNKRADWRDEFSPH